MKYFIFKINQITWLKISRISCHRQLCLIISQNDRSLSNARQNSRIQEGKRKDLLLYVNAKLNTSKHVSPFFASNKNKKINPSNSKKHC